jgi:hypothetical protein
LKGDQIVSSSSLLSTALAQDEKELYKSDYGRSSENRAKALTRLIRAAIKLSDISILLQIERNAIMADMAAYGATEKRTGALASLEQAGRLIERTSTPKGARQFLISMNGDKLPAKIPRTDMVINFIKSQKIQKFSYGCYSIFCIKKLLFASQNGFGVYTKCVYKEFEPWPWQRNRQR